MRTSRLIYIGLIIGLLVAVGFSVYFYQQVQHYDAQIETANASSDELPKYHFALIGEEMDHDYWRLVGQGAKAMEDHHNVFIEYEGPRRSNPDEQLKLLDMAIQSQVDGIIVQALNDQFEPLINQAVNNGIPVITIDTDAPDSLRSTYIGTDNYKAGQLAGQALLEDTSGEVNVGIVTGSFSNTHHQLRVEGFRSVVDQADNVEVVTIEESNITRVVAEEKAHKMLQEYPDINALYGTSALDGIGMVRAAESLNQLQDLYMATFDTLPENIALLEQGKVDVLIGQKPYEMGERSVELMLELMKGHMIQDVYHTEASVVRQNNVNAIKDQLGDLP
ncbi:sugar ABC transporter sugar-binding protein [Gracilibacillus halophilus YIM-C55.5]|uniref:Sugar ABC transporter sugar-binding protein n=1 Tax=Gracilibacillus halophilus YIM-C55.5 TaxID=1308866 RepID=N4WUN5_9BACI|nr:sugar-binding protein [Gracilibacillus halophilus]ENH98040.1 sugar ABC transporter sugar-binding protein [Gracilibacillus halophilus YIM-C55.5]